MVLDGRPVAGSVFGESYNRKVIHDDPVTAWRFIGGPGLGDGNLFSRPAPGLFDFRLYPFQVAIVKRELRVSVIDRLAFLTHLSEHLPLQPCQGGVQLNYRTPEFFYGPCLG